MRKLWQSTQWMDQSTDGDACIMHGFKISLGKSARYTSVSTFALLYASTTTHHLWGGFCRCDGYFSQHIRQKRPVRRSIPMLTSDSFVCVPTAFLPLIKTLNALIGHYTLFLGPPAGPPPPSQTLWSSNGMLGGRNSFLCTLCLRSKKETAECWSHVDAAPLRVQINESFRFSVG